MKHLLNWFVIFSVIFFTLVTSITFVFGQTRQSQNQPRLVYVKNSKVNLRLSPQGTILGNVNKSTELTLLDKKGKWVKVAVIAWVLESSVTENKDITLGPKSRASLIMVETREAAEGILTRLKAGEDFGVLAKAKSIHPTSAKEGDLGFFRKGEFSPEFERAIFAVKSGKITGIVEVTFKDIIYYCIFKRTK